MSLFSFQVCGIHTICGMRHVSPNINGSSRPFSIFSRASSHCKLAGYILNSNATISAPWNYLEIVYHLWFIRYGKKMVISSRAGRNTKIPFYLCYRNVCLSRKYFYIQVEFRNIYLYKNLNF